jgi:hypothetical protein
MRIFLFPKAFTLAVGPTVPVGPLSSGIAGPGCEADHSPPFVSVLRRSGAILLLPLYAFMACAWTTLVFRRVRKSRKAPLGFNMYVRLSAFISEALTGRI